MSSTIQLTIQPKQIDSSSNEVDLEQYTLTNTYNAVVSYTDVLTTAEKLITMPSADNHLVAEFASNQPVDFVIYDGATIVATLVDTKNFIANYSTAHNYTYKIKNRSGSDATVTWYLYA